MVNHHALTNVKANFLSFSISKFFAYFTLLFILIFIVLPIFKFIYLILLSDFINTENLFSSIASNYYFILILKNLAQALLSTVCSLVIGLPAAFFLAFVAVFPSILFAVYNQDISYSLVSFYGGTSLLIIVGVALDTLQQIESHMLMRNYDGFLKSGRIRGRSRRY